MAGLLAALGAACATPSATAAAKQSPKPAPAVAIGRSSDGKVAFRLEGRRLTATFAGPLSTRKPKRVVVRCGEPLFPAGSVPSAWVRLFAASGARTAIVKRFARNVRLTLSRDVAARTSWCGLATEGGLLHARMRVTRGAVRSGCMPLKRETVAFRDGAVVVASAKATTATDVLGRVTARTYRMCRRSDRRFVPLVVAETRSLDVGRFVRAGGWLAWTETRYADYKTTGTVVGAARIPLRGGTPERLRSLDDRFGVANAEPLQLGVAADGTVAWSERRTPYPDGRGSTESVFAALPGAIAPTRLAQVPAIGAIAGVALSADGRTVRWTEGGVPRTAALVPAAAVGSSADGKAGFRLEGRRLTVTLGAPLRWPSRGRQAVATVRCGDAWSEPTVPPASWQQRLDPATERAGVRLWHGTRVVTVELRDDLAAATSWCGMRWTAATATTRSSFCT